MLVIVNTNSAGGTAEKKWAAFARYMSELFDNYDVSFCRGATEADDAIRAALGRGESRIVAAGGDGTVNHALNAIINATDGTPDKSIIFGAVGLGSSNDFHKPFNSGKKYRGIPYLLDFNCASARDIGRIQLDGGGQRYFIINASIGIVAEGNRFFNDPDKVLKRLKRLGATPAIIYSALASCAKYKSISVTLEIAGLPPETLKIANVGIAKNPNFSGNLNYGGKADYSNGFFDLHVYPARSFGGLLLLLVHLMRNKADDPDVLRAGRLKICSTGEFLVEFDGEVMTARRARFVVEREMLTVCT